MVSVSDVTKTYRTRAGHVDALTEVTLQIEPGQFVAVCGPSGSGKTTLLMAIAGMLRPTAGRILIDQKDIYAMSVRDRTAFRATAMGFVFQMFHLVPYLNVVENVMLAAASGPRDNRRARATELIARLGLAERATHKPEALSAGERQRTAIARALFNDPKIILADEPTGNLDTENARSVLRHLADFHKQGGTIIVATHGPTAREFADRTVSLRDGRIVEQPGKKQHLGGTVKLV